MKVCKIELENYRNIKKELILPSDNVNVICGENAQGKTNILESIYLATGLKSFRGAKDRELIAFGEKFSRVKISFEAGKRQQEAVIKISDRKECSLNGVPLSSRRELIGRFNAILFAPDFLSIVQRGPEERRKFIDGAVSQFNLSYSTEFLRYMRLLRQRNTVLKGYTEKSDALLDVIDAKLSVLCDKIYKERTEFLEIFMPCLEEVYEGLSGGREKISLSYKRQGMEKNSLTYEELLRRNRKSDIILKNTSAGIHRDDIDIRLCGKSAKSFGSQGQQRSCAVALKLAEAQMLKEKTGEEPVILLDDVMSELDKNRQDYILNHIKGRQVFITCCDTSSFENTENVKFFRIEKGKTF